MEEHAGHADGHEHWEYSIYPFIISFGVLFMIPLAFSFYFVYELPMIAIISFSVGTILNIWGVAGWVSETLVESKEKFAPSAMPSFIVAEAFIFIGFFGAYWVTRLKYGEAWPPPGTPHIGYTIPLIMTVLLVSSSFTYHNAEVKLDNNDLAGFRTWTIITMILGLAFFGLSAKEWAHLFEVGFIPSTNLYSTSFFSITGFHASHVLVGLSMFICLLIPAMRGKINHSFAKSAGLYWHFVDIVWFFVVSQIYFW